MQEHDQKQDVIGGVLLTLSAALAILVANSPFEFLVPFTDELFATRIEISIRPGSDGTTFGLGKPLYLWINDGLMAIFFFLVGMEIKREFMQGSLMGIRRAALPAIAALGGVIVPALIYATVARNDPAALQGWAIPTATDIAFVVAVAASLGRAVPPALKAFLLALAIIDDLVAIIVIAVFYTAELSTLSLKLAGIGLLALLALNLFGVRRLAPYLLVGIYTWVCVLKSGVHATLSGVALGLAIPLTHVAGRLSLLERTEHGLRPWITYLVLPVFAFANAGISFAGFSPSLMFAVMPLGIALGLFLGKQIGVFGFALLAIRLRLAEPPDGVSMPMLYGAAILTGIGFTMSLFIGTLAFTDQTSLAHVRLGVIAGSALSAVVGVAVLRLARSRAIASAGGSATRTAATQA